jgi:hypothetical protein
MSNKVHEKPIQQLSISFWEGSQPLVATSTKLQVVPGETCGWKGN